MMGTPAERDLVVEVTRIVAVVVGKEGAGKVDTAIAAEVVSPLRFED